MSVIGSNALAGASGQGGGDFVIEKSLRFTEGDTPYLNKTFSSTSSSFTVSFWMKLGRTDEGGGYDHIFSCLGNDGSAYYFSVALHNNILYTYNGTHNTGTGRLLRDPSAWYHIVCSVDNGTGTLYVNNEQVQQVTGCKYGGTCHIGNWAEGSYHFDGYLAEVHFVDGEAKAPTDFGEFDDNGVWQPINFTGSYNFVPTVTYPAVYISSPGTYGAVADVNTVNGNVFTSAASTGAGSIKVVFASAITGVTNVKFKGGAYSLSSVFSIKTNGTVTHQNLTTNSSYGVRTEDYTTPIDITSFEIVSTNDGWALGDLQFSTDSGTTFTAPSGTAAVIPDAGVKGFHLDFSDNSSIAALGNDAAGSNNWTPNNFQVDSRVYATGDLTAVNGVLAPTDDPFWIDILPTNADMHYADANNTDNMKLVHDGLTTTSAYWVGNLNSPSFGGNVKRARFDLRSFGTITSCRVYGGFASGYVNYKYRMLDSSKTLIAGSEGTFGTAAWHTMQVTGSPKYLEISCEHTTSTNTRHRTYAIEVNGVVLVNGGPHLNDSFTDSPTNGDPDDDTGAGGVLSGNYCTWNPIGIRNGGGTMLLQDGNLNFGDQGISSKYGSVIGTIAVNSGKWFIECTYGSGSGLNTNVIFGLAPVELDAKSTAASRQNLTGMIALRGPHAYKQGATETSNWASGLAIGDTVSVAFDCDNGTSTWYKNGTSLGTFPHTFNTKYSWTPCAIDWSNGTPGSSYILNCGQRPFSMTPPAGYKALCTANLPTPDVPNGRVYFDTVLREADTTQSKSITGLAFSPDLIWEKPRSVAQSHYLADTVRGIANTLSTDSTTGQNTYSDFYTSSNSDGYTIGTNDFTSGTTVVGWLWDAGDSNYSVSAGGLNSSVYDQSQRWRDYLTSTQSFATNYGKEKAFDGTFTADGGLATLGVVTFTPPAMTVTSLEVNVYSDLTVTLPDGTNVSVTGVATNDVYRTIDIGSGFSFTGSNSITFTPNSGSYVYIDRIRINGKELVDDDVTVTNVPTIASTYRANPSAGFSIVSWTGTGAAGSLAHGLGKKPELIITKVYSPNYNDNWPVYHPVYGAGTYTYFNSDIAAPTSYTGFFNDVEPTSSVFTVGTANSDDTKGLVAYCFTSVESYSKIDSYKGNGSTDGPFVYTGFRPAFILLKNITDGSTNWTIHDTKRIGSNPNNQLLFPDTNDFENTTNYLDILSNGFKLRINSSFANASSKTYIYAAFAENPFQANGGLAR